MNATCAKSTAALISWARSRSQDLTAPSRTLRHEAQQLHKLHAPPDEGEAFTLFTASVEKLAEIYRTLSLRADPDAFNDAVAQSQAPGNLATRLAREMRADVCALQMSGKAR
jgi:hypothetical protein